MTLTGDIIPGSMVLVKAFSEKTAGIAKKVPPVDTGGTCIQNGTDLVYCNAVNGQFTGGAGNKASVQLALIGVPTTTPTRQLPSSVECSLVFVTVQPVME